ncbi:MAG: helix-turn-helix transcriptional regulator [Paludibacter sp.]|nr:helix-turn-helix transcriptional regulator [Paludibacter sp.]
MTNTYISNNLKFLRKRKRRTQEDISSAIHIKRTTYSGYENEISTPSLGNLIALSDYYGISIDNLVKVDLRLLRELELRVILTK